MKISRTTKSSLKPRRTHHKKAYANPATKRLIAILKREWKSLSKLERGNQLLRLVNFGCTLRGLSDDLNQPLTTIRRPFKDATTAAQKPTPSRRTTPSKTVLPPNTLKTPKSPSQDRVGTRQSTATIPGPVDRAIRSKQPIATISRPPSVKAVAHDVTVRSKNTPFRQPDESANLITSRSSDHAAEVMVSFVLYLKKQEKICKGDIRTLFNAAHSEFERQPSRLRQFHSMSSISGEVAAQCKPIDYVKIPGALWIDFYVVWLAQIAFCVAPQNNVRVTAMKKALAEAFEQCPA